MSNLSQGSLNNPQGYQAVSCVSNITGTVRAIDSNGQIRTLLPGDVVYANEQIDLSLGGTVEMMDPLSFQKMIAQMAQETVQDIAEERAHQQQLAEKKAEDQKEESLLPKNERTEGIQSEPNATQSNSLNSENNPLETYNNVTLSDSEEITDQINDQVKEQNISFMDDEVHTKVRSLDHNEKPIEASLRKPTHFIVEEPVLNSDFNEPKKKNEKPNYREKTENESQETQAPQKLVFRRAEELTVGDNNNKSKLVNLESQEISSLSRIGLSNITPNMLVSDKLVRDAYTQFHSIESSDALEAQKNTNNPFSVVEFKIEGKGQFYIMGIDKYSPINIANLVNNFEKSDLSQFLRSSDLVFTQQNISLSSIGYSVFSELKSGLNLSLSFFKEYITDLKIELQKITTADQLNSLSQKIKNDIDAEFGSKSLEDIKKDFDFLAKSKDYSSDLNNLSYYQLIGQNYQNSSDSDKENFSILTEKFSSFAKSYATKISLESILDQIGTIAYNPHDDLQNQLESMIISLNPAMDLIHNAMSLSNEDFLVSSFFNSDSDFSVKMSVYNPPMGQFGTKGAVLYQANQIYTVDATATGNFDTELIATTQQTFSGVLLSIDFFTSFENTKGNEEHKVNIQLPKDVVWTPTSETLSALGENAAYNSETNVLSFNVDPKLLNYETVLQFQSDPKVYFNQALDSTSVSATIVSTLNATDTEVDTNNNIVTDIITATISKAEQLIDPDLYDSLNDLMSGQAISPILENDGVNIGNSNQFKIDFSSLFQAAHQLSGGQDIDNDSRFVFTLLKNDPSTLDPKLEFQYVDKDEKNQSFILSSDGAGNYQVSLDELKILQLNSKPILIITPPAGSGADYGISLNANLPGAPNLKVLDNMPLIVDDVAFGVDTNHSSLSFVSEGVNLTTAKFTLNIQTDVVNMEENEKHTIEIPLPNIGKSGISTWSVADDPTGLWQLINKNGSMVLQAKDITTSELFNNGAPFNLSLEVPSSGIDSNKVGNNLSVSMTVTSSTIHISGDEEKNLSNNTITQSVSGSIKVPHPVIVASEAQSDQQNNSQITISLEPFFDTLNKKLENKLNDYMQANNLNISNLDYRELPADIKTIFFNVRLTVSDQNTNIDNYSPLEIKNGTGYSFISNDSGDYQWIFSGGSAFDLYKNYLQNSESNTLILKAPLFSDGFHVINADYSIDRGSNVQSLMDPQSLLLNPVASGFAVSPQVTAFDSNILSISGTRVSLPLNVKTQLADSDGSETIELSVKVDFSKLITNLPTNFDIKLEAGDNWTITPGSTLGSYILTTHVTGSDLQNISLPISFDKSTVPYMNTGSGYGNIGLSWTAVNTDTGFTVGSETILGDTEILSGNSSSLKITSDMLALRMKELSQDESNVDTQYALTSNEGIAVDILSALKAIDSNLNQLLSQSPIGSNMQTLSDNFFKSSNIKIDFGVMPTSNGTSNLPLVFLEGDLVGDASSKVVSSLNKTSNFFKTITGQTLQDIYENWIDSGKGNEGSQLTVTSQQYNAQNFTLSSTASIQSNNLTQPTILSLFSSQPIVVENTAQGSVDTQLAPQIEKIIKPDGAVNAKITFMVEAKFPDSDGSEDQKLTVTLEPEQFGGSYFFQKGNSAWVDNGDGTFVLNLPNNSQSILNTSFSIEIPWNNLPVALQGGDTGNLEAILNVYTEDGTGIGYKTKDETIHSSIETDFLLARTSDTPVISSTTSSAILKTMAENHQIESIDLKNVIRELISSLDDSPTFNGLLSDLLEGKSSQKLSSSQIIALGNAVLSIDVQNQGEDSAIPKIILSNPESNVVINLGFSHSGSSNFGSYTLTGSSLTTIITNFINTQGSNAPTAYVQTGLNNSIDFSINLVAYSSSGSQASYTSEDKLFIVKDVSQGLSEAASLVSTTLQYNLNNQRTALDGTANLNVNLKLSTIDYDGSEDLKITIKLPDGLENVNSIAKDANGMIWAQSQSDPLIFTTIIPANKVQMISDTVTFVVSSASTQSGTLQASGVSVQVQSTESDDPLYNKTLVGDVAPDGSVNSVFTTTSVLKPAMNGDVATGLSSAQSVEQATLTTTKSVATSLEPAFIALLNQGGYVTTDSSSVHFNTALFSTTSLKLSIQGGTDLFGNQPQFIAAGPLLDGNNSLLTGVTGGITVGNGGVLTVNGQGASGSTIVITGDALSTAFQDWYKNVSKVTFDSSVPPKVVSIQYTDTNANIANTVLQAQLPTNSSADFSISGGLKLPNSNDYQSYASDQLVKVSAIVQSVEDLSISGGVGSGFQVSSDIIIDTNSSGSLSSTLLLNYHIDGKLLDPSQDYHYTLKLQDSDGNVITVKPLNTPDGWIYNDRDYTLNYTVKAGSSEAKSLRLDPNHADLNITFNIESLISAGVIQSENVGVSSSLHINPSLKVTQSKIDESGILTKTDEIVDSQNIAAIDYVVLKQGQTQPSSEDSVSIGGSLLSLVQAIISQSGVNNLNSLNNYLNNNQSTLKLFINSSEPILLHFDENIAKSASSVQTTDLLSKVTVNSSLIDMVKGNTDTAVNTFDFSQNSNVLSGDVLSSLVKYVFVNQQTNLSQVNNFFNAFSVRTALDNAQGFKVEFSVNNDSTVLSHAPDILASVISVISQEVDPERTLVSLTKPIVYMPTGNALESFEKALLTTTINIDLQYLDVNSNVGRYVSVKLPDISEANWLIKPGESDGWSISKTNSGTYLSKIYDSTHMGSIKSIIPLLFDVKSLEEISSTTFDFSLLTASEDSKIPFDETNFINNPVINMKVNDAGLSLSGNDLVFDIGGTAFKNSTDNYISDNLYGFNTINASTGVVSDSTFATENTTGNYSFDKSYGILDKKYDISGNDVSQLSGKLSLTDFHQAIGLVVNNLFDTVEVNKISGLSGRVLGDKNKNYIYDLDATKAGINTSNTFIAGDAGSTVLSKAGSDLIMGGAGADFLQGASGNDVIYSNNSEQKIARGEAGEMGRAYGLWLGQGTSDVLANSNTNFKYQFTAQASAKGDLFFKDSAISYSTDLPRVINTGNGAVLSATVLSDSSGTVYKGLGYDYDTIKETVSFSLPSQFPKVDVNFKNITDVLTGGSGNDVINTHNANANAIAGALVLPGTGTNTVISGWGSDIVFLNTANSIRAVTTTTLDTAGNLLGGTSGIPAWSFLQGEGVQAYNGIFRGYNVTMDNSSSGNSTGQHSGYLIGSEFFQSQTQGGQLGQRYIGLDYYDATLQAYTTSVGGDSSNSGHAFLNLINNLILLEKARGDTTEATRIFNIFSQCFTPLDDESQQFNINSNDKGTFNIHHQAFLEAVNGIMAAVNPWAYDANQQTLRTDGGQQWLQFVYDDTGGANQNGSSNPVAGGIGATSATNAAAGVTQDESNTNISTLVYHVKSIINPDRQLDTSGNVLSNSDSVDNIYYFNYVNSATNKTSTGGDLGTQNKIDLSGLINELFDTQDLMKDAQSSGFDSATDTQALSHYIQTNLLQFDTITMSDPMTTNGSNTSGTRLSIKGDITDLSDSILDNADMLKVVAAHIITPGTGVNGAPTYLTGANINVLNDASGNRTISVTDSSGKALNNAQFEFKIANFHGVTADNFDGLTGAGANTDIMDQMFILQQQQQGNV